ncbi:RNA-directed DNA polymerase, eukaryota [Tanacetum coccineum]|uniref:RNA-directed DNA polymerase, eukaryota n=1 Tax=Tanacetum coccineum TaxID=301880 RepID=A0ABQ5BGJ6_9ASTR
MGIDDWHVVSRKKHGYRSYEDDVAKISISIYVSNLPETFSAKDLFHACNKYGHVVDSFIPLKRSKEGKRFGFVKFINVSNVERLVGNLCTVWVGRYKLQANKARFGRPPLNGRNIRNSKSDDRHLGGFKEPNVRPTNGNKETRNNSFASVLKSNQPNNLSSSNMIHDSSPAIALDDDCLSANDLSCVAIGKIKDINALSNLSVILNDEGFDDIKISYLGGYWVLIQSKSCASKEKLINHAGVLNWFHELGNANNSFVSDIRLVWIAIEGLPMCAWNNKALSKIVSPWGTLTPVDLVEDSSLPYRKVCVTTKVSTIINDRTKIIVKGKVYWIRIRELEPWSPELDDEFCESSSDDEFVGDEKNNSITGDGFVMFQSLDSLNENIEKVINEQDTPQDKIFRKILWYLQILNRQDIKRRSGSEPSHLLVSLKSSSVGLSGGILCVWDPNSFVKDNATISDYFVAVRGTWLILLLGDINEVRSKQEKVGTIFNETAANAFNHFISTAGLIDLPLEGSSFTWAIKSARNGNLYDTGTHIMLRSCYCYWASRSCLPILVSQESSPRVEARETPLSPYLFILVMESLHLSFNNIINADLFKGIRFDDSLTLSHLFYADDAVFIGKWDRANILTIVRMLKCFFLFGVFQNQYSLRVNSWALESSKEGSASAAANIIGCSTFSTPFSYLGVKVGMSPSRRKAWDEIIGKVSNRLSKWKIKTLSIGGRLTLIKSVLTSLPLYHMSLYKAPLGVLRDLESLRRKFFNGADINEKRFSMISWNKILASKQKGGLGLHPLDRLIAVLYGNRSPFVHTVGNGANTLFWEDCWINDVPLSRSFPRLYALELKKGWKKSSVTILVELVGSISYLLPIDRHRGMASWIFCYRWVNVVPNKGIILALESLFG